MMETWPLDLTVIAPNNTQAATLDQPSNSYTTSTTEWFPLRDIKL